MTNHQSADTALDGALDTLARLDDIGFDAYTSNAPVLITEAAARAAVADAVTNRIRLLNDLLMIRPESMVFPESISRTLVVSEMNSLIRSVVIPGEA